MEFSNLMKIIIEMFIFAISLIQRWTRFYYQRMISLLRIFSTNFVEIPLSDKRGKVTQAEDPWKGDGTVSKPKFISLPVFSEENERNAKSSQENSNNFANEISDKPIDELNSVNERSWINPRDNTSQFWNGNSRSLNTNSFGQRVNIIKKKSYMSNTAIKLADYNTINRNYLSQEDFNYSFIHPSAPNILNKSYLVSSSHCLFKQSRNFKRKTNSFKSTDLSTIYENLAY